MRMNLKLFRCKQLMSQEQIAEHIGCQRSTYAAIESGIRNGRHLFWSDFQKAFSVSDEKMWELMKNE